MIRTSFAALALALAIPAAAPTQTTSAAQQSPFTFEEVMVPMRDGARLQTVILRPRDAKGPLPILFQRTPYGVPGGPLPSVPKSFEALVKDGYIFVFQSMRGRFKSDGDFTLSTGLTPNGPDEATDAYDAIDWLVKNVPGNNGRVGMWGISYPGFAAAIPLAKPHPALKATSPQAAWIDYWQNDDLHRWGAARLSYITDWVFSLQADKTNAEFTYDTIDTYDFFLRAGSLADIEKRYVQGKSAMIRALIEHPDHDAFYTRQRWSDALGKTTVPTLNVAGFWDQEDPWGSWQIFAKQRQNDPDNLSQLVVGPWAHGTWSRPGEHKLGPIDYKVDSSTRFVEEIQAPFFRYWLHGQGERPGGLVNSFQSGSWVWKRYDRWPLAEAKPTALYLHADGALSFTAPAAGEGCRGYVSDPANPVPFRARPISPTYPRPEWRWWEAADQRFVAGRPDVLSYVSAPLDADLTVTGAVLAELQAATSGTDSDFVVKLIDVFPDDYEQLGQAAPLGAYTTQLNGYQLPIAMEVRRGRYLASDTRPAPLVPNQVTRWEVPLRAHDHVFKKGHRLMVQVQSSWFPVIDRNPQKFVPNIAKAQPQDYVRAEQKVCAGSKVILPVVR
ncbi:MAG: CocE/NonD family hydrolase [Sphingomonas sp.]|uniref:CocE/NonD family hydrolase n=1 Tax=Sphingomonas sp. TaxID=28214 RepID=UPI0025F756A3|nr:CocE/NonD family hydrolase [Sphingomonas sp.]MBX9882903.1 CocE/NonD family hydrolase [Sphingomonas sp.]